MCEDRIETSNKMMCKIIILLKIENVRDWKKAFSGKKNVEKYRIQRCEGESIVL
jgi:hypothetical protein